MRRFLQHVLPRGFVKIRHFGLLAPATSTPGSSAHTKPLPRTRSPPLRPPTSRVASPLPHDWRALLKALTGVDLAACPDCGAEILVEPLTSDHPARAPPPPS